MKTRVITVPTTLEGEAALDIGESINDQLIELYISDETFYKLSESNFFEGINSITGSNIDDYEDDLIKGNDNLLKVISFIEEKLPDFEDHKEIVLAIRDLFESALKSKTGVYFYF